MKLNVLVFSAALGGLVVPAGAYDVVLKSGKILHGTLVKESDESLLIHNTNGVEFTIQKKNVDLVKTTAANKTSVTSEKSTKKGRVYTADDIARVREKINLGTFEGAVAIKFTKAVDDAPVKVDAGFESEVLNSHLPVLVDFYADWCGPCRQIAPRIDAVAAEFSGKAKIYRVNVDKNEELTRTYQVASIPTLLFFKDGEVVGKMVGLAPQSEISQRMKELVQ